MWPDNRIVKMGIRHKHPDGTAETHISDNYIDPLGSPTSSALRAKHYFQSHMCNTLVGHNIKFDLLYILRYGWLTGKELTSLTIWDTQLVEYLLSAQMNTYPSLDECSVKYGGRLKDDKIKEFWESGVQTECIPEDMLAEYLLYDCMNTELVYLEQKKLVEKYGMQKLVASQCQALAAVTLMEFNGMHIDREYIVKRADELAVEINLVEKALLSYVVMWPSFTLDWQWSSPKDVSMYFFGGKAKRKEKQHVGKYKNGKDKFKTVEIEYDVLGVEHRDPLTLGSQKNKLGYWTTDDTVLKNIGTSTADHILSLRMYSKQRETYYVNLQDLLFPADFIHANLNLVSTKTGRLSCNKPNIQNQTTEGGIKKAYNSRWDDGVLVDFDYSQLEMAGLAAISNDTQLAYDINHGVDMHEQLYKEMYGRLPTKDERKKFKSLSFGLVYGAGARTLADNAGCSVADAKRFIDVFYSRYKGVGEFHTSIQKEAAKGRKLTTGHTPKGEPIGAYLKRMPTGRMYLFHEYDNEWKGGATFSPTELKNWPVQGFATGDIVPHMVGHLVKQMYQAGANEYALPIMTVHDSIVFDVKQESLDKFIKAAKIVLSNTTPIFERHYGITMPVKLSVGCSFGPTWGDQVEYDLSSI
jgi:DNA polymerase I-like protein with 3'-5' exonuclease and polymerase domains